MERLEWDSDRPIRRQTTPVPVWDYNRLMDIIYRGGSIFAGEVGRNARLADADRGHERHHVHVPERGRVYVVPRDAHRHYEH